MLISAFFADRVEFVEEQDALPRSRLIKESAQSRSSLTKVTSDDRIIANAKHRNVEFASDGFSERGLAISRGSNEQDAMTGLQPMRAEQFSAALLLDQLRTNLSHRFRQDQISQPPPRLDFVHKVTRCR